MALPSAASCSIWSICQSVIDHILQLAADDKALPGVSIDMTDPSVRQQLAKLRLPCTWVGKDIILTAAAFLQRLFKYTTTHPTTTLLR